MTSEKALVIEFRSFWHCGGGRGVGAHVDASCLKDEFGLPYVPGKTCRGLLRHALKQLHTLKHTHLASDEVFGTADFKSGEARTDTKAGRVRIGNAVHTGLRAEFKARRDRALPKQKNPQTLTPEDDVTLSAELFQVLRMTAIDNFGAAKSKTLRSIEVALPLRLSAPISVSGDDTDKVWKALEDAAPLIRGIGLLRSRGLGSVTCSIEPAGGR